MEKEKISISIQTSGDTEKIQIEHDNRQRDENGKPFFSENVNPELSQNNDYIITGNIRDFYKKTFQKEYEEYIERVKIKHPERVKDKPATYLEEVSAAQIKAEETRKKLKSQGLSDIEINRKMTATKKTAYQMIVQLGDRSGRFGTLTATPQDREIAKKLMREFVSDFQKRYPQMKIINAVIHCDEVGRDGKGGTIHTHITYCPVVERTRGQAKQNSLTGALKDMGFDSDTKKTEKGFHFAVEKWQQEMRNNLEKQIEKYGLERLSINDTRRQNESPADFGRRMDTMKRMEATKELLETMNKDSERLDENLSEKSRKLNSLDDKIAKKTEQMKNIDEMISVAGNEIHKTIEEVAQANATSFLTQPENLIQGETSSKKFSMMKDSYIVKKDDFDMLYRRADNNPNKVIDLLKKAEHKIKNLPIVKALFKQVENLQYQLLAEKKKNKDIADRAETLENFVDYVDRYHPEIIDEYSDRNRQTERQEQYYDDDFDR